MRIDPSRQAGVEEDIFAFYVPIRISSAPKTRNEMKNICEKVRVWARVTGEDYIGASWKEGEWGLIG